MEGALKNLVDLIGPAGSLAAIMTFFVSTGIFIDNNIKDSARATLGQYVASGRASDRIKRFSTEILAIFKRLFGENHWTRFCLIRSFQFTALTVAALLVLVLLHPPPSFAREVSSGNTLWMTISLTASQFLIAMPLDYFNLFKTRIVLNWLAAGTAKNISIRITILVFDFAIYAFLYLAIMFLVARLIIISVLIWPQTPTNSEFSWQDAFAGFWTDAVGYFGRGLSTTLAGSPPQIALFLAGLVPSVWIWACVAAIALTSAISHATGVFRFVGQVLPIEEKPARSIGIVAGLLCCVVYLAAKAV